MRRIGLFSVFGRACRLEESSLACCPSFAVRFPVVIGALLALMGFLGPWACQVAAGSIDFLDEIVELDRVS